MELIKTFVRRPVTTVMMVLLFVVLGIVSYNRMAIELFPEIDFPFTQIISVYEGAGPEELESQVVKKIEDEVSNISDIEDITSYIYEGYAWTLVEFDLDVDIDIKSLEVKDKVEQIKRDLPDAADDPVVAKFDPMDEPVAALVLVSDELSSLELYELADKKLKNIFSQISGVSKVDVMGGSERQINVWAKLDKMAQYGLTVNDLLAAIGQQNLDIPAGNINRKTREIGIRFKGEAKTAEEIANINFFAPPNGVIKISDVARVEDGSKEIRSIVRYTDEDAVMLGIYKRSDGNIVEVVDGANARIEEVRKILPSGVEIKIGYEQATYISDSVQKALNNIIMGVILCAFLLWIFLRDVRITFVAAIVIPTSIVSAFMLMDLMQFSINVQTLMALCICIGTLVANAIVVLENISRHVEMGTPPREAAVVGTKEVAVAVLASAGTNIVVFTPIAYMSGIVGEFFFSFGLTVVFATIFSLIASFSLTPMLSGNFIRGQAKESEFTLIVRFIHAPLLLFEKLIKWLQNRYSLFLWPMMRHPVITVLATLLVFFGSLFLLKYVGGEAFPASDQGIFQLTAQLQKGATDEAASEVLEEIERVITSDIPDDLKDYFAMAGGENRGLDEITVYVRLVDSEKREHSINDVMYLLQPGLSKIAGVEINTRTMDWGPSQADLDIDIYGPDYEVLAALSREMRQTVMDIGNFRSVYNKHRDPKDEVHFIPDSYRRADYKIPNVLLGMVLRHSIEGQEGGVLRIGGEEYDIKVRLEEEARNSIQDMKSYKIATPSGLVPLSALGTFERKKGIANLVRKNKQRVITLECYFSSKTLTENRALIEEKFKEIEFPPGYYYQFAGISDVQEENVENISVAFILAIILTYMLLAAILNSFLHPITIMITVPLGMAGVFIALFFTGVTFNLMSMMAMVMLVGIVVNNAILIIDYAMQLLKTCDKSLKDCIHEACMVKFRAIMMTNLAIIAGVAPLASGGSGSEFMVPMAAAMIGGVAVSTFFTLFTVPALFYIMESGKQRGMGRLIKIATGRREGNDVK